MTSSPASSAENQFMDTVSTGAISTQDNDCTSEQDKDEEDEEEEGDVDFNPFMKEAMSLEASSSLSSEIEEFDADVVDSGGKHSPMVASLLTKASDDLKDFAVGDTEHGEEIVMQSADSSGRACSSSERASPTTCDKRKSSVISESENTTLLEKENKSAIARNTVDDVTVEELSNASPSKRLIMEIDDEDAICRRTRARYSLASFTLDELETFLQETDDEDDFHNIDDEEEYRKFLAAVLQGGDASSGAGHENENFDDEDEDNDADFELELEEALESDVDENLQAATLGPEHEQVGRRPETRQKNRQKANLRHKEKASGQINRPLRPILPHAPIAPFPALNARSNMDCRSSSAKDSYSSVFTPQQVGQLHCLIYEHVQLLVQVFSLSILEPSRQHIATQVQELLLEMLQKRDQGLVSRTIPYPSFCFNPPYIRSTVPVGLPKSLPMDSTPKSSAFDAQNFFSSGKDLMLPSSPNLYQGLSNSMTAHVQPMEAFFWAPFVSCHVLSVIDVAPLHLVRSYMEDVSIAVWEHQRQQVAATYDASVDKECLFPFESFHLSAEASDDSSPTLVPSSANDQKTKKTTAAALVERSKKQSIALVPKQIAKLALRFFPLFNPALFPHKPPPASIANRVLFTDSEDVLLARGLMECNTNWKEIQKNFLPCKSTHQIFIRQKNRACARAPENPIKAVRRMKNSPLTLEEQARIEEGLKVYKFDWISIWKYMVPHRDPSLLARQWRTAIGTQKSYKKDEEKNAKRRLYGSQRKKLKCVRLQTTGIVQDGQSHDQTREGWSTKEGVNAVPGTDPPSGAGAPRCQTSSGKENCSNDNAVGGNNSGDDGVANEDEAYVHEAFLADWRPRPFSISSELPISDLGRKQRMESFMQEGSHARGLTKNTGLVHPQHAHDFVCPSEHSQHPNSSHSAHLVSAKSMRCSELEFPLRPYRARRSDHPRLVKLAPDLPPVNLPPSVRVMSQSAFTKYRVEASSKIPAQGSSGPAKENVVSSSTSPCVMKSGVSHPSKGGLDEINPVKSSTSHLDKCQAVEKDDSDLHMHPLLFQAPEDGSLPYYPLNGSARSASSFNFFPSNHTQLNLSLFRNSHQAKHTFNFFSNSLKSKGLNLSASGVDFHPLLQRNDDENGLSRNAHPLSQVSIDSSTAAPHQNPVNVVPTDSHGHKGLSATNAIPPNPDQGTSELDLDIRLSVTAREENGGENRHMKAGMNRSALSAHESGNTETQPSSSNNQHKDFRPAPKLDGITNGLGSSADSLSDRNDMNDSRDQPLLEIVMEQEELSDSEEEMAESVEFECEEMTDSEGERGSDSDQIDKVQNEDVQHDSLPIVVVHEDSSGQDEPRRHGKSKANKVTEKFGTANSLEEKPGNLLGLSLNLYGSLPAKSKLPVTRNCRSSHPKRSKSATQQQPPLDAATAIKKPRKRAQKLNPRRSNVQKPE